MKKNLQPLDINKLTDDKFNHLLSEMMVEKFQFASQPNLERKPKADKGV